MRTFISKLKGRIAVIYIAFLSVLSCVLFFSEYLAAITRTEFSPVGYIIYIIAIVVQFIILWWSKNKTIWIFSVIMIMPALFLLLNPWQNRWVPAVLLISAGYVLVFTFICILKGKPIIKIAALMQAALMVFFLIISIGSYLIGQFDYEYIKITESYVSPNGKYIAETELWIDGIHDGDKYISIRKNYTINLLMFKIIPTSTHYSSSISKHEDKSFEVKWLDNKSIKINEKICDVED